MDVTIILCTRNRSEHLAATLDALHAADLPRELDCELLVVDNGSTDRTRDVVSHARPGPLQTRYLFHGEPGKCSALNAGLAAARGSILAFTDDDVRPRPGWLTALIAPIRAGQYDAVAGEVCIAEHLHRPWMTAKHRWLMASTEFLQPDNPESAVGANMAVAAAVLRKVPHFEPELGVGKLGFWDDTLFFYQLREAGYRIGMSTASVMEHHFDPSRLSRAAFVDRAKKEGRSRAFVSWHWKHEVPARAAIRAALLRAELYMNRTFQPRAARESEEVPAWELDLVRDLSFFESFSTLRSQPRLYELRGLRRLR